MKFKVLEEMFRAADASEFGWTDEKAHTQHKLIEDALSTALSALRRIEDEAATCPDDSECGQAGDSISGACLSCALGRRARRALAALNKLGPYEEKDK